MVCCEDEAVDLRHGFHWVVLNASAWETLAEGPLRSLLKYVAAGEEDGDALVADIAAAVRRANGNAVWRQKGLDMLTYAACDPDIKAREILQYRHVCVLDERHHNRDDERSCKGNRRKRNGYGQTRQQNLPERIDKKIE